MTLITWGKNMGNKKQGKRLIEFSIIILLIVSQIIFLSFDYQNNKNESINMRLKNNPFGNRDQFAETVSVYYCFDFIIVNNHLYMYWSMGLDILDISNPSDPVETSTNETILNLRPYAITKQDNIILMSIYQYPDMSLMKIDLDEDSEKIIEIDILPNIVLKKMILRNDLLYSVTFNKWGFFFLIHNATNIENINLIGNTSINHYSSFILYEDFPDFYMNGKNSFFITEEGNLAVYQINETYQLSFIKEYNFTNLNSLYFTEEYLLSCDETGLRFFNYSNVENLNLVKYYNITNAQSVQIDDNLAYLITKKQMITLDVSNFDQIEILDQYILGKREHLDLMKVEMKDNLAIVMTEDWMTNYPGYTWYLYIFDITSPNKIKRIYPKNIPVDFWPILGPILFVGVITVPIIVIGGVIFYSIRKRRKVVEKNGLQKTEKKL